MKEFFSVRLYFVPSYLFRDHTMTSAPKISWRKKLGGGTDFCVYQPIKCKTLFCAFTNIAQGGGGLFFFNPIIHKVLPELSLQLLLHRTELEYFLPSTLTVLKLFVQLLCLIYLEKYIHVFLELFFLLHRFFY